MKFLIVDDEPLALIRLQKMLEQAGITDIITASNGQNAVDAAEKFHPHVVFLDIQMPVLTGIEAAPIIKRKSPESKIVFCTAYDDFAIKAFDLSASDYLLKPVTTDRLNQTLDKVIQKPLNQSLTFQQGNDLISIELDDVYCFISEDKYTNMRCQRGTIIIDESLVTLESRFPEQLLRINRNALINISELYGIHRENSQAYAKLKSIDYQPRISRRNIVKIKELLK